MATGLPWRLPVGRIPHTSTMLTQAFRATTFDGTQETKVPVQPAKTCWATEARDLASLGRHGLICETLALSPRGLERSKEETCEKVLPSTRCNYSYLTSLSLNYLSVKWGQAYFLLPGGW